MKRLMLGLAFFTFSVNLTSQRELVAPPDMLFTCESGVDLSEASLQLVDHPILGNIRSSELDVNPVITRDRVCEVTCTDQPRYGYDVTSPIGAKACQFYNDLFDSQDPDREYDLDWGLEGYAKGYDSVYVFIDDQRDCFRGLVRRYIVGVHPAATDTVSHDIWTLNCEVFFINQNDPHDPDDCLEWDFEPHIYIHCKDGSLDSILSEKTETLRNSTTFSCEDCDVIGTTYSDQPLKIEEDFSIRILRTWIIINWCEYDPLNPTNGGRWEYAQIIHYSCSPPSIKGHVYIDDNDDCIWDSSVENTMWNWQIIATDGTETYHALSNQEGEYYFHIPDGDYEIKLIPINQAWTACSNSWMVTTDTAQGTVLADLGADAMFPCREPQIEVTVNRLRRCRDNTYFIDYHNSGTEPIFDSKIEIQLDQFMILASSSLPSTDLGGGKFMLDGGDLLPGELRSETISVNVNCDSTRTGQTLCVSAKITPTDSCDFRLFDGPIISTRVECIGSEVQVTITNNGSAMETTRSYWVVEDDLIMFLKHFKLDPGKSITESFPALGKTYTVVAEQTEDFPAGEYSIAALEGCRPSFGHPYSRGFLTQFAVGDQYKFEDTDCTEITGAFDPNDKQVYPKGYGTSAYIQKDQVLEYTIRFQNTGNDTAFKVTIRDNFFDKKLDPSTLKVLQASHDYRAVLHPDGSPLGPAISFVFDDIFLPDSFTNEPASHGFIKFSILPSSDIKEGEKVENLAFIDFDFEKSIMTNTVSQRIFEDLLTAVYNSTPELLSLEVFPNPTRGQVMVRTMKDHRSGETDVYDHQGKLIKKIKFNTNLFTIDLSELQTGTYFVKVHFTNGEMGTAHIVLY